MIFSAPGALKLPVLVPSLLTAMTASLRGVLPGVGDLFDGNLLSLDLGCVPQSRIQHAFWIKGINDIKPAEIPREMPQKEQKKTQRQLSRCELNVNLLLHLNIVSLYMSISDLQQTHPPL